jgi:hypothetical protein
MDHTNIILMQKATENLLLQIPSNSLSRVRRITTTITKDSRGRLCAHASALVTMQYTAQESEGAIPRPAPKP